jgi:luciferase family oxidoreductase group 1
MTAPFPISILDQSPIVSGYSARDAIAASVELAQLADRLGFHRYWLAEHHGLASLGDPCPEILLARIASVTARMRVGTGGILLPYYTPFKIAEQFRMLEALFPGRIDLGLGRAPGGDIKTAQAVAGGRYAAAAHFPEQVAELVAWLDNRMPDDHPLAGVIAQPAVETAPEIWMLGSSDFGGALAAQLGLRFAFAHFINPHGGDAVARAYRGEFNRGGRERQAVSAVAVFAVCAQRQSEAEDLSAAVDLRRLQMAYGVNAPIPTVAEARVQERGYSERDKLIIAQQRPRSIIGTPDVVRDEILAIRERYSADEVVVLTVCDYATRLKSFELLAEVFNLTA